MMEEMEFMRYDGCIDTYSGRKFSFADPKVDQIDIADIARGLSFSAHFGGQTQHFFSIAQHCMLVCDLIPEQFADNKKLMLAALLHDASEAYTGDMVKPLKNLLPEFKVIEDKIQEVIFERFQIPIEYLKLIKPWDLQAQQIEYDAFFKKGNQLQCLYPMEAKTAFNIRFLKYIA